MSSVEKMKFWIGKYITALKPKEVFVFGGNRLLSFGNNNSLYCPNFKD